MITIFAFFLLITLLAHAQTFIYYISIEPDYLKSSAIFVNDGAATPLLRRRRGGVVAMPVAMSLIMSLAIKKLGPPPPPLLPGGGEL